MTTKLLPKSISQHKLRRYAELSPLVKEHEDLKEEIKDMAAEGLPCQPGRFSCRVETKPHTSIAWKTLFIESVGQGPADQISAREKGNSSRRSLVVTDRENPTG